MKELVYVLAGIALIYLLWGIDFPSYRVTENVYTDSTFYTVNFKSKIASDYTSVTDPLTSKKAKMVYDSLTNGKELILVTNDNSGLNMDGSFSDPNLEIERKERDEKLGILSFIAFKVLIPLVFLCLLVMIFIRACNEQPLLPWL